MANKFSAGIPCEIVGYMNCGFCMDELRDDETLDETPESYAWVQAGVTEDGKVQVWCVRHQATIALIDDLAALKRGFDHSQAASTN